MAFDNLTATEIEVGEPTKKELFRKIKDSLTDLDDRVTAGESGASGRPPFILGLVGEVLASFSDDEVAVLRIDTPVTLLAVRAFVRVAGDSGTFTIDIEYKRDAGAWSSILSAPIDVVYTEGDYAVVSGTLGVTSLLAGDLLRLKVSSAQVNMRDGHAIIEHEVA